AQLTLNDPLVSAKSAINLFCFLNYNRNACRGCHKNGRTAVQVPMSHQGIRIGGKEKKLIADFAETNGSLSSN
ncbi:MAG: hypothetical protein ACREN6_14390, partial [Gemmatimonadaceae bacterium]